MEGYSLPLQATITPLPTLVGVSPIPHMWIYTVQNTGNSRKPAWLRYLDIGNYRYILIGILLFKLYRFVINHILISLCQLCLIRSIAAAQSPYLIKSIAAISPEIR